ncbi:TetR/AcrR family transcriptional regulator [Phenylobacterium sp. LjRoot225]|uniref:TetR/AcrR family transcriptional regulator n=1 Tax=Phenylobacterium sp. LjRoot225 TaxID=3342285 RepID=UPI003ED09823
MGTPAREARREDRRDAILDVAYECFVAEGYGSTSMSTIAARLGGSKGTLYNYFKSKEELFDAFVRRRCASLHLDLESLPKDGELRPRLVQMARAFLDHLLSPEAIAIHRLVVGEGERFPELARLFYEAGPRTGIARAAAMFEKLMTEGKLRRADPTLAAHQLKDLSLSGVYHLRLWGVIPDPSPAERQARAETAVDTFLRAYAPDA